MNLWTVAEAEHALAIKAAQRPVSATRKGVLKCSGKWSPRRIAHARAVTLRLANAS